MSDIENKYIFKNHKLVFNDRIFIKEISYVFLKNNQFDCLWANGLKKVYDFTDKNNIYNFEKTISYLDDDQIKMLKILIKMFTQKCPNICIDYVFVNYLMNFDKSKNLIKQMLIVFENNSNLLVLRIPQYAINTFVWNDFLNDEKQIAKNADSQDIFWQEFNNLFLKQTIITKNNGFLANNVNKVINNVLKKKEQKIKLSLDETEAQKNQFRIMLQDEINLYKYDLKINQQKGINMSTYPHNIGLMETGILFKPRIQLNCILSLLQKELLEIISKYDHGLITDQQFNSKKIEIIKKMGINYHSNF